jgi:hypothetical protein
MADAKPLASLSAGLLARKGAARPAMRRQTQLPGMGNSHFNGHEDLGWNDMGYDVDPQHAGQDGDRMLNHGLSPMIPTQGEPSDIDAMDAFTAAVERAMIDPVRPVQAGPASIAPMIADAPLPQPAEPPLVVRQQEEIVAAVGTRLVAETAEMPPPLLSVRTPKTAPIAAPGGSTAVRARAGTKGNFAFTLRLDPERHLRLRLASATSNRSAQQILIALVDDFLSTVPEIDAFAARLPASASR